jgi:hypothetical protein
VLCMFVQESDKLGCTSRRPKMPLQSILHSTLCIQEPHNVSLFSNGSRVRDLLQELNISFQEGSLQLWSHFTPSVHRIKKTSTVACHIILRHSHQTTYHVSATSTVQLSQQDIADISRYLRIIRDSSVSIVTRLRAGRPGFNSRQ